MSITIPEGTTTLYDIHDLATCAGFSVEHARNLRTKRGALPPILGRLGGALVWSGETVQEWVASRASSDGRQAKPPGPIRPPTIPDRPLPPQPECATSISTSGRRYRPSCTCGWIGPEMASQAGAQRRALAHSQSSV